MSGLLSAPVLVAVPGQRRATGFARACEEAGLGTPALIPWVDVLRGTAPAVLPPGPVRIDSPGEDTEVFALLAGADAPSDPHRVEGGPVRHARFVRGLERIRAAVAASPGAWLTADPDEIPVMFDKRAAHARLSAAGVPVAPVLEGPFPSYAELRARMREQRVPRVFVKPAHGSSASGVVALETAPGRVRATAPVEVARDADGVRLYNSLRVRRYEDEESVAALLGPLCAEAPHVERWVPKLTLDGLAVDLRVLVVAGRPTHVVARSSRFPMTNLHLGNARADVAAVRAAVGGPAWAAAMSTCVRAAACFPRTLHVGVDLLFAVDGTRHVVAEVNAFGDLLPRVLHAGRDTWAEQVHALRAGWRPPGAGLDEEKLA